MSITLAHLVEKSARLYPENPAVTCDGHRLNWAELWARIQALGGGLDGLGLARGSRVGFLGLNSAECYECYHGPSLAGLTLVALNFRLSEAELHECLLDCAPEVLVVDKTHEALARGAAAGTAVQHILVTGLGGGYETLIARGDQPKCAPTAGDDTVVIYYTGGTTGRSKGVELSHNNVFANAAGSCANYDFKPFENHLIIGPLFHTAAGSRAYTCPMLHAHLIMTPKFDIEECLALIETEQVQVVQFVPTMIQRILDHPAFERYDLSSLRQLTVGASPTPLDVWQRIFATFPKLNILNGYGATETGPLISALGTHQREFSMEKLGSAGPAVPHAEVVIRDENGAGLPSGEIGEVTVRGPNVMTGYLNRPEETAEAIRDSWYHTGDAGYLDEDACLWIVGRIKDMIISGGENIYPIEIENHLSQHPDVAEVAVIGVPDADWGERVQAIVILREGGQADEAVLIAYCREALAHYKCPRGVTFRTEPLPLSTANKVLKTALRAEYGG